MKEAKKPTIAQLRKMLKELQKEIERAPRAVTPREFERLRAIEAQLAEREWN